MDDGGSTSGWSTDQQSRFGLAPPRHFLLPAVLLLLSEEDCHGYRLASRLAELRFGHVDRPGVYRALAQLEGDGLVEAAPGGASKAGQERRSYRITDSGERALRAWMGVIKEERDRLDGVLRRYMATGTIDAILAEAAGGWTSVAGRAWSPVTSTSPVGGYRARSLLGRSLSGASHDGDQPPAPAVGLDEERPTSRFRLVPERSVVLIEARSTVGPITFGAIGVTGTIDVEIRDGVVVVDRPPVAHLEIDVHGLRSGNSLYDAELLRRIDARRYPVVTLDLRACIAAGLSDRYRLEGDMTLHGVSRPLEGTVTVTLSPQGNLVVAGAEVLDIRDFDIGSPTVLMLRIYPDVRVQLQVEAELDT